MRNKILFSLLFFSVRFAQPSFTAATIATGMNGALSVFAIDLDNDGDMDVLSASEYDNKIMWYENDGSQSFTVRTIKNGYVSGPSSIYAVDVDSDGDIDVLSASGGDDKITWYENNANQDWPGYEITNDADNARYVYAVDVDSDGDMDVLSASAADHKIAWYENNGSQSFTSHTITTNARQTHSVYAADIDRDGDMDILATMFEYDKIVWYKNDGSENFTENTINSSTDGVHHAITVDLDSDGDIDIISASEIDDKVAWYENDGNESFTAQTITTSADAAQSVYAIDVDNDGDIDVLSASTEDDKIAWYENDGSESFTARTITASADGAYSVYAADMDNDGDMDVLSASYNADAIAWYENTAAAPGTPTFTATTISTTVDGASVIYAADIDADGDIDILSGEDANTGADDNIRWHLSTLTTSGGAGPGFTSIYDITSNANGIKSIYTIDLDSDGDLDVLSASLDDNTVAWFESNGASSPTFTRRNIATNVDNAESAYAIDIDHDGDIDVVTAGRSSGVDLYKNDGSQSFTAQSIDTDYANSVYALDVDADGDNDIIAANSNDNKVVWYENNYPTNSFSGRVITSSADGVRDVFAIDLDRDGDIDLVTAEGGDHTVAWYENDGVADPSFTARTIAANSVLSVGSVYALDMDRDGDVDVLSASQNDDKIQWYQNNGSQSFTTHTITSSADGAQSVYAIDIDSDGDIDVLSASENDDKIAWYSAGFDNTAPSTPTGLVATPGNAQVVLTWTANSESDLASYKVYGGTSASPTTLLSTISSGTETYTHTGLTNGRTYYYRISAVDNAGNESDKTSDITAMPTISITNVTSSNSNGYYTTGQTISIQITFDGSVSVGGQPHLDLNAGTGRAYYNSGGGSSTLTFNYQIGSGDESSDLGYASTSALNAAGVSGNSNIRDGNDSDLDVDVTLPSPGTLGSLSYNKNIIIDISAPTISSVSLDADNTTIAVTMSEAVYNTNGGSGALEASDFALSISGGAATLSSSTPTSISISGNVYTLGIGLSGIANGSETLTVNPVDNGIYDAAGNEASTSQSNNTASLNAIGESLSFDGSDDYVEIPKANISSDINNIKEYLTLSVWVYLTDAPSGDYFVVSRRDFVGNPTGERTHFQLSINSNLSYTFKSQNNQDDDKYSFDISTDANTIETGKWQHLVATFNDGTIKQYVNGGLKKTEVLGSTKELYPHNHWINFGMMRRSSGGSGSPFKGKIDEIGIWNDALTANEITALYNSGVALDALSNSGDYASSADLKGYWKMEEGTGTTITDLSGNGNNGTISGAQWATGKKSSSYTNTVKGNTAPTISSVSLDADNTTIAVTMSEAVYNTNGGSGALEAADFALSISGGTATLSSSTPTSISISGNVYTLGIGLSGIANGSETLTVTPVDNGIYDAAGNESSTSQSNNTASLNAIGESLSFDGSNDYVDVSYTSGQIESEISISAWVNLPSNSDGGHIIFNGCCGTDASWYWGMILENSELGGGIQPKIMLHTDQGVNGGGHKPSSGTGIVTPNSGWHHVAMTYSSNTLKIYLDGSAVHTATVQGSDVTESNQVNIGGWENADGTFSGSMNGKIDEVAIWNDALTADEITALYNSGVALDALSNSGNYASSADLKGYWKMEEGTGTTITDLSGNGNDGTISGASWATGKKSSSYTNTVIDITAPSTPTGLVATPGDAQMKLTWTANSESDLASYKVYRGTSANPTTVLSTVTGSVTLTNSSLTNGTTYYYRISAVDNAGNESSKTSDVTAMPHNTDNSYSLSFDGSDDVVTVSSTSVFTGIGTGNFSISLWAKFDADDTWEGLISKGYYESGVNNALVIRREEDGNKIRVSASDGTSFTNIITGSTAITNSTDWFHAVLTRSSNSFTLYINGSSDGTGSYSGSLFDNSEPIEFGQGNGTSNSERLDGYLDEIAFWNKGLTSAEASALYNSGAGLSASSNSGNYASSSNLKGYWKFSENSGTTAYDLSGLGHHGTISGAAYNTSTFTADETAPTISSVSLDADNTTIAVTMSEAVYNTNGGSGALEASDFALSISGGTATLSSSTPTSISISGNVYTLGIGLSGIANGSETITVTPVDDGIYDAAGNEAGTSQSNNTASLNAIGESLSFDGSNDVVTISHTNDLNFGGNIPMSVSFWMYRNTTGEMHHLGIRAAQNGNCSFQIAGTGNNVGIGSSNNWDVLSITSPTTLLETWTHVVFTFDGDVMIAYINGAAVDNASGRTLGPISGAALMIGGLNYGAKSDAKFDEVAIWNDDLSATEVAALYNSGIALDARSNSGNYASSGDLKGYWKMEEGTGTTLTDLSGYGNNGAISGATWATGKKSSSYTNTAKDITGPTVTFAPANGATGVAVDRNITITFNEAARKIDDSALTDSNVNALITLKTTNASGSDIAFEATIDTDKKVITINPTSDFSSEQVVYVAIGATVEDANDNAITASSATFTVVDVNATSVTFSPADGAKDIAVSSNVTITFGEAVRKIDDSAITDTNVDALITLKSTNASGDDIGFDATINSGKTVITVNPTNDFSSEQVVYAAIGATVEDDANNAISATSITFTAADVTAPATPTGIAATVGNSKVVLAWNTNAESDLASYKVYGGTSANPTTVLATVNSGQTYTHSSLTNGTTYYYRISAVDNAGNESDKTSDITAVPTPQKYAVKKDGTGDYTTIQAGITAALTGDTILVYEDTYEEHIDFGGKDIIVTSNYITTNDTLTISNTIIKGTTTNAVVIFSTGNSTSGTLNGFTVTNGKGIEWTSSAFDRAGGGIYMANGMSPTISNCFIRNNICTDNCIGAGIMVDRGSPIIENCIIENNITEKGQGGGIYIESGSSTNVKISRTIIRNNSADFEGGGIFSNNEFELVNSYVYDNVCARGSEIFASGIPLIINSTLYQTKASSSTYMLFNNAGDVNIFNSILWSTSGAQVFKNPDSDIFLSNSIILGGWTGAGSGNIASDPQLNTSTLKIENTSPAIGAGVSSILINSQTYNAPSTDYFGATRPYPDGTNPDIGAYEDSLGTPFVDTTAPTVTLSPANGAAAVSVNSNITITFNEAVRNIDDSILSDENVDSHITLKETNDSGADISFDATINDQETIITINPENDFASGEVVYVSIGATLEDYSDNATAAASSIFSTIDNVAPAIIITPSDGAAGVAIDANITISFNEVVRKLDDTELSDTNVDELITLKDTNADGSDISFDATVVEVLGEKTIITVDPTNNFSKGQTVYVQIDALVEDSFDNVVSATNSIFTVVENQRPIAGTIRDGLLDQDIDLFTSTTSISANWDPFVDDGTSITYEYAIGKNLTSLNTVADWTSTGTDTFMTKAGLAIETNIVYYVSVRGTDAEMSVSDTVTTDGQVNTVDTEVPIVTNVSVYASQEASTEMSWSAMTDSLTVRAVATDNIGLAYFKFSVGSGQQKNNVADWTQSEDSVYSFTGLTFTDGTYQTWAKAYDASDNVSVEVGSNTFQIDASGPIMGIVNDGGSEDVDLIETSTDFSLSWAGFDDGTGIGIESYEFSIGTTKGGVDILNFVNAGLVNTYSVSSLNLVHGELYYSSVKAVDKLGNWSALASSDGFTLDEFPGPASIVSVSPAVDTNLGLISNPKITFQFSEDIQSAEASVSSPITGQIQYSSRIVDDQLEITIEDNLASKDEVKLKLENVLDLAGVSSEPAEFTFNTSTLADFTDDGAVNAADLSTFVTAWNNKDFSKELAPTTGQPPNLIPDPDSQYNLRDAMAFTRMWQWSKQGVGSKITTKIGEVPTVNQIGNQIEILWPDNTTSGEIQINYPQEHIAVDPVNSEDSKVLFMSYKDENSGRVNIAFADLDNKALDNTLVDIKTENKNPLVMEIVYMFYDHNSQLLGEGTIPFGITPIPNSYNLSHNYPNPFNPITTIDYDLPDEVHATITVFDLNGREVVRLVDGILPAGFHTVKWHGKNNLGHSVSGGIYFYQIRAKDYLKTRKMVLLK